MTERWQEDDCRNADGFTTIRHVDPKAPDCPHGDTSVQPIATVYDDEHCAVIAAAPHLLEALEMAVAVMRDADLDEAMAGEFEIFTDALNAATGDWHDDPNRNPPREGEEDR